MKACYFHHDKEAGRVLIPGCYAVAHRNDIAFCECDRTRSKKSLEEKVEALEVRVKELEKKFEVTQKGLSLHHT